jgi:two-component system NarL family sensor kinase
MPCNSNVQPVDADTGVELGLDHRYLAETLHDGVMQWLVAIRLNARAIALEAEQLSPATRASLTGLETLTDRALDELTVLVRALESGERSPVASGARSDGLVARIRRLTDAFARDTGIACRILAMDRHLQFPPDVADVIYRSVVELLNNVEKHAGASRVQIRTDIREDGCIVIGVADDGKGAPEFVWSRPPDATDGFGLFSIQNRLLQIGASLEIEGRHGFSVRLILPAGLAAGSAFGAG